MTRRSDSRRRPQAAAIPFRRIGNDIQFCLVTSSGSGRWGIPKGLIERGDSPETTALQEAREEAGLHGQIVGKPVGHFEYEKWGFVFRVTVFLMSVSGEADEWDEQAHRARRWVGPRDAVRLLDGHPARDVVLAAIRLLGTEG